MRPAPTSRRARGAIVAAAALAALLDACAGTGALPEDTASAVAAPDLALQAAGGEQIYARCSPCHLVNGAGIPGAFPPLAGSEYVLAASPVAAIRVVLRGAIGPLTVKGVRYDGAMPPYGTGDPLSDAQVAAVLTYVRSAWGNRAPAVLPADVARERASAREGPVTARELERLP